jgi:signal peptidase II
VALTSVITAGIALYGWRHAPNARRVQLLAGAAILGGAAANVIDRAPDGVVTDYLHTGWWPTFNLADTFLVVGGLVLVLSLLQSDRVAKRGIATVGNSDVPPSAERNP